MKVTIQLDADRDVYTSADWLKGNVLLALQRADAVNKVTLTLQGKLVASVVAQATNPLDGALHALDNHKLFKISQTIFPQHDVPIPTKGFSLSKGNTSIPFKLRLPVSSTCQTSSPRDWVKHLNTTLPPSFKFLKNDGNASVEYYIRVKVTRPGRFKSNLAEKRFLQFLPLDPAMPPPMMEPTRNKSTRALRYELPSSPRASIPSSPTVLDTRIVTLAATLPAPAILILGRTLPLSVFLTVRSGVDSTPNLFLRTMSLALLTETTINIGPHFKTWTGFTELANLIELDKELDANDEQYEVPNDLWKDVKLPESVTPSFTTCALKQEHFVVIVADLSYGRLGNIHTMKTMLNVELHSGIDRQPQRNEVMTPEEEESEEQIAFVPWRLGADRHLGILGRRDSRTDDAPPPPY